MKSLYHYKNLFTTSIITQVKKIGKLLRKTNYKTSQIVYYTFVFFFLIFIKSEKEDRVHEELK